MGLGVMRKVLLLVALVVVMPSVASALTPFRPLSPFQPSAACLSVYYGGDAAYWLNRCPYSVVVRWIDDAKCQNWSCVDQVPANARSAAAISTHVRWCECRGTLSTCNLPADGC